MKINLNINVWTVVVFLAAAFLLFGWSNSEKKADRWEHNYEVQSSEFETYQSEMDGVVVAYKESILLTERELKDALESDSTHKALAKKYREQSQVVKIETEYLPQDTMKIPVPMVVYKDTSFLYGNSCIEFDLSLSSGFLSINDIRLHNTQNIVAGERKSEFWKTEQSVDVTNSNPCLVTTGLNSYTVTVEKKWYNNPWITIPSSFAVGFATAKLSQ